MTTLVPRAPYTDDELRRLYPAGLELQLVQVLMRHGERTPVSPRFQSAGLHPFWPYCAVAKQLTAAVLEDEHDPGLDAGGRGTGAAAKPMGTLAWKRRLEMFAPGDDAAVLAAGPGPGGEVDAVCDMGMLTDRGRATTLQLGRRLRQLYVERLGFLPAALGPGEADRLLYLRATPVPRALESLQQALTGLYPGGSLGQGRGGAGAAPVTIVSRAAADETLFPNDSNCRRFAALARAFAQRAADRWNDSDELAHVTRHIGRWLPPDSPRAAVDGRPRLSGIQDTINATRAHGPATRLPAPFYDEKSRRDMERVTIEEWFAGYYESNEYRTLGIGGLMGDLTARMVAAAEAGSAAARPQAAAGTGTGFRFGLSGCHDTTLAAVVASLGHPLPGWPPFTSHIAVELFKQPAEASAAASASASAGGGWLSAFAGKPAPIGRKPTPQLSAGEAQRLDGYYVRVRYNDEVVPVPACRAPGKHLDGDTSFCTLAAFKAVVDKFTPRHWRQECRSNLDASPFPSKPEPSDASL